MGAPYFGNGENPVRGSVVREGVDPTAAPFRVAAVPPAATRKYRLRFAAFALGGVNEFLDANAEASIAEWQYTHDPEGIVLWYWEPVPEEPVPETTDGGGA